ncbi:MAG: hypothetical protein B6I24_01165 [Bacteroidetes bacterium 4572_128]|nr:MAG: hypothetical protein B6I24_01165 [Bacteroidetes bacterium 4572_128]
MRYLISLLLFIFLIFSFLQTKEETVIIIDENHIVNIDLWKEDGGEITKKIDKYFKKLKRCRFNGNVLVAHKGKIIYENYYGYSDLKKKDTLNLNSVFQLASVSKQFTAMAIMILKERELLNYSDTVQKFFPRFPYKNITVRQLLTHRSGLGNYLYFCSKYEDKISDIDNKKLIELMIDKKPAIYYRPNLKYDYNNTGYAILASIVEKVSGIYFKDFIKKNIFDILNMEHSYLYEEDKMEEIAEITKGHHPSYGYAKPLIYDRILGDKGVFSTIEDMFKWDRALYSNILVKKETIEEAFKPAKTKYRRERKYGFGFRIKEYNDSLKIAYHGGWWRGYTSLFMHIPETESSIVILANRVNRSFFSNYHELLEILTDGSYKKNKKRKYI